MPQSLAKILIHTVFSTRERRPFLRDRSLREELHHYLESGRGRGSGSGSGSVPSIYTERFFMFCILDTARSPSLPTDTTLGLTAAHPISGCVGCSPRHRSIIGDALSCSKMSLGKSKPRSSHSRAGPSFDQPHAPHIPSGVVALCAVFRHFTNSLPSTSWRPIDPALAWPGMRQISFELLLTCVLIGGCKPRQQIPAVSTAATNTFYRLGLVEGARHATERPTTSLMVFPSESTNWSEKSVKDYRSGYLQGLGTKP